MKDIANRSMGALEVMEGKERNAKLSFDGHTGRLGFDFRERCVIVDFAG